MPMATIDEVELKAKLGEGKPVIVDFYADWCAPCRAISPVLEDLQAQHGETVEFVKVDADANPELLGGLQILGIPTVIRFDAEGREEARSTGAVPASVLAQRLGLS